MKTLSKLGQKFSGRTTDADAAILRRTHLHSMGRAMKRALFFMAFLGIGVALAQSNLTKRVPVPTPIYAGGEFVPKPPPPPSYIRTRSASQQADKGVVRLTANCKPGEVLVGGAYSFGPSSGIAVVANYPSSETGWTNEFHVRYEAGQALGGVLPPFQATLTSLAYCLAAPGVTIQMQTVVKDNDGLGGELVQGPGIAMASAQSWAALCPAGSVLTGGGFAIDGPFNVEHDALFNADVMASQPLIGGDKVAKGWSVSLTVFPNQAFRRTRAYARCALNGLKATTAGETNANLTQLPYAAGYGVAVAECGAGAVTTGGGYAHTGDWLISHWVSASKVDGFNFESWRARSFGAYQTPRYEFRPCTPITAQCLSANVIAACFIPPDIDYISVRITSPPSGHAFGLKWYGAATTERIAFTAQVYDKRGALIPNAVVRWTSSPKRLTVPPPGEQIPSNEVFLGHGSRLDTALYAGQTIEDVVIKASAVVRRPRGLRLSASDTIVLTVGTVP